MKGAHGMSGTKRALAVVSAVVALGALAAGCGDSAKEGEVRWDSADPCTLLDGDALTPLLTEGLTDGRPGTDGARRSCAWGEPATMNTVTVTLTSAPQAATELRTLAVGEAHGSVLAESTYQCIVAFDGGEVGALSIEAKFGADAVGTPQTSCDRVVAAAEQALGQLHWSP